MTIQEILKSIGYSDADIQAIDPKLLQVIGETYGAVETERDSFKSLKDQWQEKLDQEYNPAITQAEKAAFDARNEAAALKSRVEFAEQFGYLPKTEGAGDPTKPTAPVTDPNVFDPTKHNLVTKKDLESAYGTFADAEGRAMTLLHDLSDEYRYLYGGKTLYEYVGAAGKRGMTALRTLARPECLAWYSSSSARPMSACTSPPVVLVSRVASPTLIVMYGCTSELSWEICFSRTLRSRSCAISNASS